MNIEDSNSSASDEPIVNAEDSATPAASVFAAPVENTSNTPVEQEPVEAEEPELTEDQLLAIEGDKQALAGAKLHAQGLGMKFHPNIGLATLRERITEREGEIAKAKAKALAPAPKAPEKPAESNELSADKAYRAKAKEDALSLIRVNITCMDKAKSAYPGEIITAGNSIVGTVKKMVKFNVDYHIPKIIYNVMKEKKFQYFYEARADNGQKIQRSKLTAMYAINVLPDLTKEELDELAQRQLMETGSAKAA